MGCTISNSWSVHLPNKYYSSELTKCLNGFVNRVVSVMNNDIKNFLADSTNNNISGTKTNNFPQDVVAVKSTPINKLSFSSHALSLADCSLVSRQTAVNSLPMPQTEKQELTTKKTAIEAKLAVLQKYSAEKQSELKLAIQDSKQDFEEYKKALDDVVISSSSKFPNNSLKNIIKNLWYNFFNRSHVIKDCKINEIASGKWFDLHCTALNDAIKKLATDTSKSQKSLLQDLDHVNNQLNALINKSEITDQKPDVVGGNNRQIASQREYTGLMQKITTTREEKENDEVSDEVSNLIIWDDSDCGLLPHSLELELILNRSYGKSNSGSPFDLKNELDLSNESDSNDGFYADEDAYWGPTAELSDDDVDFDSTLEFGEQLFAEDVPLSTDALMDNSDTPETELPSLDIARFNKNATDYYNLGVDVDDISDEGDTDAEVVAAMREQFSGIRAN